MKTLLTILTVAFFATVHAQTGINQTPNPCHGCWGQSAVIDKDSSIWVRIPLKERIFKPFKWYSFRTYKFEGGGKRAVWIGYFVAGIFHGGREAYHAEPGVFEKRFGVGKTSWFGSEQWRRNYPDLDPTRKHKPDAFNTFRDYYHFSNTLHTVILIGGAVTIGASEQPIKYRLLDTLIAITVRSAAASLTYNILR